MDECIRKDILSDILRKNRAEVIDLFMTTYDAKLHKKAIEEEAREEGLKKGIEEGIKQGIEQGIRQGIEQGIEQEKIHSCYVLAEACRELGCEKEMAIGKLVAKYSLTEEEAGRIVDHVWRDSIHE